MESSYGLVDTLFDGGACTLVTGCSDYAFHDGTSASSEGAIPVWSVAIRFADRRHLRIQQDSQES